MTRLITLGETLGVVATLDGETLRSAGRMRLSTAGAESTVAIGMARLGHRAGWIGVVGSDEVGRRVVRDLRAEEVATPGLRVDPDAPTGFMVREVGPAGSTRVCYYRTGSAGSTLCSADVARGFAETEADLLHVTGITAALSESAEEAVRDAVSTARARGMTVSLDVNYRSRLPRSDRYGRVLGDLLPDVDVLFGGSDELWLLTDEADPAAAARSLVARGPGEVVVKRGTDPALAVTSDGSLREATVRTVSVVDVVGAGDSFTAGYLAARAEGRPVTERLRWGVDCAAATVAVAGDWEGIPLRDDIEAAGATAPRR